MNIIELLLSLQLRGWYRIPHFMLALLGLEIPKQVIFNDKNLGGVKFVHRSPGTILHPMTRLGKNVHIYQNVTIGKSRPWDATQKEGGCYIMDDAIICAGTKLLFSDKTLIVGKGTVIGANAVLTQSTGDYEIWAGIPARKIGIRK